MGITTEKSKTLSRCSVLIGAIFSCAFVGGCMPPAEVAVPQNYVEYNSPDGVFALDYPEGWEAEGNGNRTRGTAYANITQPPIKIRIDATLGFELKAGMLLAGGGDETSTEGPLNLTKEGVIHDSWRPEYEEKYSGYEEEPGYSTRFKLGPARVNKFSGKQGYTKIKGIRATFSLLDRMLSFEATCPESQWPKFEPVFEKMLESFHRGVEQVR